MLNVTGKSWWANRPLLLSKRTCAIIILILFARTQMLAQKTSAVSALTLPLSYVGDAPTEPADDAGGLSPALRSNAVREAILKVGDWQLGHAAGRFSNSWEFGALYDGYVAAGEALRKPRYITAMTRVAESLDWKLRSPDTNPDNEAVAQMYLDLAVLQHRQDVLNSIQSEFNRLLLSQHDTHPWSWCDTLFMAPPVWARLYAITGDKRYLDYIDREWWNTSAALYVPDVHLYMRDRSFFDKRESNGKRIFWARGNGWIFAGLVQVLQRVPSSDPYRDRYVKQFQEMASSIARLQQQDGSWHASLLDPQSYSEPENSATAFFVYGLAWGIDHGLLSRARYEPVVALAWKELVAHIYKDGRLGSIQPGGGSPAHYLPSASYVYGVGAFLLAGTEVLRLAHP